jgi:hypothetical protein
MDTVVPTDVIVLDPALLQRFPEGYRHIAYVQTKLGFAVNDSLPQLKGPAVSRLYSDGNAWLGGSKTTFGVAK